MRPDKDKPWTWVKYKSGMCTGCSGACCTMPVEVHAEDLIKMKLIDRDSIMSSPKKAAKKLIKEKIISGYRESSKLFMLASRPSGDCIFLHEVSRLCTIYENRPSVCRSFPDIGPKPGFCPCLKVLKI